MSIGVLQRLGDLLREQGGLIATLVHSDERLRGADGDSPGIVAAEGPRASGRRDQYELLVEAIYEGYLVHYATPRVVRAPEDDLGLLAGDQLYAIGLAQLVALGDTFAVAELADTITLSALAHGAGRPTLADAVWSAGARAVGWGSNAAHAAAKALVASGAPEALDAMRTSAEAISACAESRLDIVRGGG